MKLTIYTYDSKILNSYGISTFMYNSVDTYTFYTTSNRSHVTKPNLRLCFYKDKHGYLHFLRGMCNNRFDIYELSIQGVLMYQCTYEFESEQDMKSWYESEVTVI